MKVGIVIICYNLPVEIFMLQIAAIRKFCKDEDFTIEVFDNSTDPEKAEAIRYHAGLLGVNYYKTFSHSKGSSDSHSFAANFSYRQLIDKYNFFFYLDHDAIPIKEFSVVEILSGGHVMAGIGQGAKKKYFWPGAVMWAADRIDKDIIDFSCSSEFGLDTGGNLYKVVDQYGQDNCIFFNEAYHQNPYYVNKKYNHYAMIKDETFMHFVASSGWNEKDGNQDRMNSLINIVKEKTGL